MCAPCVPPITAQHDAWHMLGARLHACARRSLRSSIGTAKYLRRGAQDELLMAPGLQIAGDRRRFAFGVSRAAWHTKALHKGIACSAMEALGWLFRLWLMARHTVGLDPALVRVRGIGSGGAGAERLSRER